QDEPPWERRVRARIADADPRRPDHAACRHGRRIEDAQRAMDQIDAVLDPRDAERPAEGARATAEAPLRTVRERAALPHQRDALERLERPRPDGFGHPGGLADDVHAEVHPTDEVVARLA